MSASTDERVARVRGERRLLRPRFLAAAGVLLLLGGFIVFMGIITAETLYPGYSTSANAISDLGATEPPNSVIEQPSAHIFNGVMMAGGVLVIAAAFLLLAGSRRITVSVFAGLTGVGMLGVGVFPGNYGNIHATFALVIFIAGGLAAILSVTVQRAPAGVISVLLGVIGLVSLFLYMTLGDGDPMSRLGIGGVERWVAYPVLVWVMTFGGYLMGKAR